MSKSRYAVVFLLLSTLPVAAFATTDKPESAGQNAVLDGSPFQVNAYTPGAQYSSRVGMADDGSFVVTWQSQSSEGGYPAVLARLFDPGGSPIGQELVVTSDAVTDEAIDIAVAENGEFIVLWHSTDDEILRFQRFDSVGLPLGSEVDVTTGLQNTVASLGLSPNGNFMAAWSEGTNAGVIRARIFGADGSPLVPSFQVGSDVLLGYRPGRPGIAATDSRFLVLWGATVSNGDDTDGRSVRGRVFDALGDVIAGSFQVNTYTPGNQLYPAVSVDADDRFVAVWQSKRTPLFGDGAYSHIRGRRLDSIGTPLGEDFVVQEPQSTYRRRPSVESEPEGSFVVTWRDEGDVWARRFDESTTPLGEEIPISTLSEWSNGPAPEVAIDAGGKAVVIWDSISSVGDDTDQGAIQGRMLRLPIFRDGFESGDTSEWSSSTR